MFHGIKLPFQATCLALVASMSAAQAGTIELDFRTTLNRASEANFQILLSQEGVISQEESTRLYRSGLFPQVSLEASQSRSMVPNIGPFSGAIPGDRYFFNSFDAVLRTRLALLDTRTIDDWRISKLTLAATKWQLDDTVQEILRQIAISYLTHWRNVKRLTVLDSILERDRLLLKIANDQQQAGVATILEVTRAEVQLNSNELVRLQQETAVLRSSLNLKRVLNLPLGDDIVLDTADGLADSQSPEFSSARFEELLANRADFKRLQTEVERETLARQATRRDQLPSLAVSGQWGYAAEEWGRDAEEQWAVQLGLSVPVFEGFRIDANKRLADSALRQREIELADLRSQIEAEYRLVLQQVESSARQVEVANRARDLSQREFDLERIRFEEGVADNSQVVIAQTSLADAEDRLVEAEFQYFLARINQARTEGDVRQLIK